jgi:TM2 domain-containing membrane protein YozV
MTQPPWEPPAPDEPAGDPTTPLPPGYGQPVPAYGMVAYDPQAKSKVAAGLFGILLGGFGVHRFYLGYTTIGVIQIVVTIFTCGIGSLWGFIEGILYLVGANGYTTDATGRPLRD